MKKIFRFLQARLHGSLYAAFVPLASFENTKLASIYGSDQNLSSYLNNVFIIAISVGATIAVLRFAYAGYTYMGSDLLDKKQKAREMITDVFIGLFLLLSVYLVLYQINPNILKFDFIFTKIDMVTPTAPAPTAQAPTTPSDAQKKLDAILADEQNVRIAIQNTNFNININRGPCTSLSQTSGCTNVGLLPSFVINRLDTLQRTCTSCGGGIIITGGTEFWMHKAHGPRIPVVDLQATPQLVAYVGNRCPNLRIGNMCTVTLTGGGGYFFYEDSAHFHLTFF